MNKKTVAIILGIIIIIAIVSGAVWYFQKDKQNTKGKCGDGICGKTENNTNCPADCPKDEVSKNYGIYELMHPKQQEQTPDANIDYPYLSGAIFGMSMKDLEPQEGKFDFSEADNLIKIWQAKNKKVAFSVVVSGAGGGTLTPEWVFDKGAKYIDAQKNSLERQPILWDPIFLSEYEKFISKIAEKYDGSNDVGFIIIGTGVFTTTVVNYPAVLKDTTACQKYNEYGYSDKVWYETMLKMVEINQKYFKKTPLILGLNDFYLLEDKSCLPNSDPENYNYLKLAREVSDKGVSIYIHHLGQYVTNYEAGTLVDKNVLEELEVLSEISKKNPILIGMDNPTTLIMDNSTTNKSKCDDDYRFGEPDSLIDFAFGVDNDNTIPEINPAFISFYEQDIDAAEDGKIHNFECKEWKEKFDAAFKKAYAKWK